MTKENGPLFRYVDTACFEDNRVHLPPGSKPQYINASWIEYKAGPRAIATQGPVPASVVSFLRMAAWVESPLILMPCRLKENGQSKCEQYWPPPGKTALLEELEVTLLSQEQVSPTVVRRRISILRGKDKERPPHELTHLQYTGWPDWGLPEESEGVMFLVDEMLAVRKTSDKPVIVHCSAGVGRTGTVLAIALLK